MAGDTRVLACRPIHIAGCPGRSGLPVVECLHLTVVGPDDHEPAATDVPGFGVHHGQGKSYRYGSVDGVSSPAENVPSHLARNGTSRYDHRLGPAVDLRLASVGPGSRDPR